MTGSDNRGLALRYPKLDEEAAKTGRRIRAPEKVADLLGGTRYHDGIPVTDDPPEEQREAA